MKIVEVLFKLGLLVVRNVKIWTGCQLRIMVSRPFKSRRWCSVSACRSPKGIAYFPFPKENSLAIKWFKACRRKPDDGPLCRKTSRVCELHFEPNSYSRGFQWKQGLPLRRVLHGSAIPTLYLDGCFTSPAQKKPLSINLLRLAENVTQNRRGL